MKISVIIAVGAQASGNRGHVELAWTCGDRDPRPCDFREWVHNNWWASAVESFNFATNNWEKFTNTVKSVGRAHHF